MYSIIKSGMASAMHELSVISNNISNANDTTILKNLLENNSKKNGMLKMQEQL